MNFELRTLVVGLAAFAGTGLLAAALVPMLAFRRVPAEAAARARYFARLRLTPAAAGIVAGLTAAAAFLAFESRRPRESVSSLFLGLAIVGALLVATSAWRWFRLMMVTRRITREWLASARPIALAGIGAPALAIDPSFPIVAIVGLLRPKLVIAQSVLASCTPDELRAVLAHEQNHLDRHDNLRRLAMTAAPDLLAWLPLSARLFSAWHEASEEAADDAVSRDQPDGRLYLASALVKVARLASVQATPALLTTATLYAGGSLEGRVRRLLESPAAPAAARVNAFAMFLSVLAIAVLLASQAPGMHEWIEAALHTLP